MTPRHGRTRIPRRARGAIALVVAAIALLAALAALPGLAMAGTPKATVSFLYVGPQGGSDAPSALQVVNGGTSTVTIGARHDYTGPSTGPTTLKVTLPPGVMLVRTSTVIPEGGVAPAKWSCGGQVPVLECRLLDPTGSQPYLLPDSTSIQLVLLLKGGSQVPVVPAGEAPQDLPAATVDMTTEVAGGPLTSSATMPAQAVSGPLPPRIVLSQVMALGPNPATNTTRDGFNILARNVGGVDAITTKSQPAIVAKTVVKNLQVRGLTITGRAWSCTKPPDVTCTYRGTVAAGALAEPLQVRWQARLDSGGYNNDWTINGTVGFAPLPQSTPPPGAPANANAQLQQGSAPFSAYIRLRGRETLAQLAVHATAPKGIEVLAGRSASTVRARVSNVGGTVAPQVGLRIQTAKGVTAAIPTKGWKCTGRSPTFTCSGPGQMQPGGKADMEIALSAPATQAATSSKLDLTPLGRKMAVRGKVVPLPLRVLDPGDPQATPQIWFKEKNGSFAQWRHGGYTDTPARDAFTYRLAVVNNGGDALAAGTQVSLTQAIGKGIPVESITPGPGVSCAKGGGVRCTITPGSPVNPGTTFATVQVTIRPTATAERAAMGDVVTRVQGVAGDVSLPMKLRVVDNPNSLRPSMKVTQSPTSGGVGTMTLVVGNEADSAATGLSVVGTVPPDVTVTQVRGSAWNCSTSGRKVNCAYPGSLGAGKRTAGVTMRMTARGKAASRPLMQWDASAVSPGGIHQRGMRKGPIPIRGPIAIAASASPTVISASRDASATRRRVSLNGTKSVGNGVSLDYLWRQRCTTAADAAALAACKGAVAPRASVPRPNVGSTTAVLPKVTTRTNFVFELQITDGSAVKSQLVTVTEAVAQKVSKKTSRSSGASGSAAAEAARVAAAQKAAATQRAGAVANQQTVRKRTYSSNVSKAKQENSTDAPRVSVDGGPVIQASKGQTVSLVARGRGRITSSAEYTWSHVAGPPVAIEDDHSASARIKAPDSSGVVVLRVTARDPSGLTASAEVAVDVDVEPSPQYQAVSNQAAKAAQTGGTASVNLGQGITGTLARVKPATGSSAVSNGAASAYTFSNSTFSVGVLKITAASGTMTAGGVQITAGKVSLPSSMGMGPIPVSSASPLILTFAAGTTPAGLAGQVVASNTFALLPLPTGWSGNTTITFGGSTWTIDANAVGDGDGTVSMSGTLSQSGTWTVSVTGDNLLHIASATVDVSGQLTNASGSVQSTITGALAAPVELAPGVNIPQLTATWNQAGSGQPVIAGSGAVQIISGSTSIQVNAGVAFNSSQNWKLTLTGSGPASWSPVPGLTVSPSNLSGSVGMAGGVWQWDVVGKISQWNVTSVLTLNNIQLDLTNQCSGNSPPCPNGSMFFGIDVSATLDPPLISAITAQADAIIGLGSGGGFAMNASLGTINIAPGLSLGTPQLGVTWNMPAGTVPSGTGVPSFSNSTEGGFAITATGGLTVPGLGSFSQIAANITSQGWSLGGFDPDGVSLAGGNGTQTNTYFGWSSFASTMSADIPGFGPQSLQLTPGSIAVTGGYQAPSWFSSLTGGSPPNALGTIQFNPSNGFFTATISLPGAFNIPGGGSKMDAVGLSFEIENDSAGLTVIAGATVNMSVKGMNGGAMTSAPQLDLDMGFDVTTQTVQASMTFLDPAGWNNAFDVSGLTVNEASFTLSVNLDTMIPGLSLLASGALPESVTGPFQVPNQSQIPITVGAELSDTNPCIDFQVGSTTGTTPVLQVGGGVATANYFEFILAPTGCQLSPQSAAIPAGFQMAFDGSLLGATVDVSAALTLAPSTSFTASVDIGAFALGGLQFQKTTIGVTLDEAQQINDVSFSGGFTIFGNGVSVAGSLDQNGKTTTASLTVSELGTWKVSGFSMQDMKTSAQVTFGPGVDDVDVSASGKMNILGQTVDVQQFSVQLDNGVVEEVAFDITTSINIASVATASGQFNMQYTESSGVLDLNAAVVLTTSAGFSIGTPQNPATLDISPQCSAFQGQLAFSPVFTATLAGTIAYQSGCAEQVQNAQGQMVTPQAGDFSFSADDVALTLGPFDAQGSVGVGNVGGVGYAQVATQLKLGPQSTNDMVSLSGDFQSNGNFAFNGSAVLDLAGFNLQTAVSASNQGGNVSVAGSASLSLGGTQVQISGQFSEVGGAPSTTLTGAIPSLSLGGYDVGSASVTLTQTPSEMGVAAAVSMQVGNPSWGQIQASGQISFVENLQSPGAPLFYAAMDGSMGVPALGASVNGSLQFSDCTNNCTQPAPVDFTLNGTIGTSGFNFSTSVSMSATGDFSTNASTSGNECTGTVDLVVVQAQGCFGYQVNLFMGSVAPYGAVSASASADVSVQTWDASPWYEPWKWHWGNWHTWGISVGASVQLDPFHACVDVFGANLCV